MADQKRQLTVIQNGTNAEIMITESSYLPLDGGDRVCRYVGPEGRLEVVTQSPLILVDKNSVQYYELH